VGGEGKDRGGGGFGPVTDGESKRREANGTIGGNGPHIIFVRKKTMSLLPKRGTRDSREKKLREERHVKGGIDRRLKSAGERRTERVKERQLTKEESRLKFESSLQDR